MSEHYCSHQPPCCPLLAQAREEIERIEKEHDHDHKLNAELLVKLSKLERVKVAVEHLYYARLPKCDCPKDGGGTCFACELKAALRLPTGQAGETEGKA